ncbi:CHAT domain-containing protein [Amycolatopsis sp. NPDC003731]
MPLRGDPGGTGGDSRRRARYGRSTRARLRRGQGTTPWWTGLSPPWQALAARAPVAHLATHDVLDTDSPLGSVVLLATGAALTTADLVGERLGHGPVVVSACHTGEGNVLHGDELLGLSRALFAAGARSAVVTLWAVYDRSAAVIRPAGAYESGARPRPAGVPHKPRPRMVGSARRAARRRRRWTLLMSASGPGGGAGPGPAGWSRCAAFP